MTFEELPPDPRSGYEVAPRRIGEPGRRRRLRLVAAVAVVVALSLAVAKPWQGPEDETALVPPAPSAVAPSPPASYPAAVFPSIEPWVAPNPAPTKPPSQAGVPISRSLVAYAGAWGIGTGGWWTGEREPWTTWTSGVNLYEGLDAGARPAPSCDDTVDLTAGRFVAITSPSRLAADYPITATRYLADGTAESIPDLVSVSRPADEGTAYLFLNHGGIWPPGPHRFVVRTPAGPVSLDACLVERTTSPHNGEAGVPSGILDFGGLEPLASALEEYGGVWGVGAGGWLPNGVAWSSWQRAAPRRMSSGDAVTLSPPDCGDMDAVASGVVVAVTTEVPIADPKDVAVLTFGAGGRSRVMTEVRRLPRGAEQGIVTFFRADGEPWRTGPYRFVVATRTGPIALDACFLTLGAGGG